jgi:glucan phosphoethanolaminetransferase (alkaline phosphatase superfamily)
MASLAANHYLREGGGVPATPAALLISTSRMYGPYLVALLFTLLHIGCRMKYPKYFRVIQVGTLSIMLLYASFAVLAMMTPFMCMCDAWQQW